MPPPESSPLSRGHLRHRRRNRRLFRTLELRRRPLYLQHYLNPDMDAIEREYLAWGKPIRRPLSNAITFEEPLPLRPLDAPCNRRRPLRRYHPHPVIAQPQQIRLELHRDALLYPPALPPVRWGSAASHEPPGRPRWGPPIARSTSSGTKTSTSEGSSDDEPINGDSQKTAVLRSRFDGHHFHRRPRRKRHRHRHPARAKILQIIEHLQHVGRKRPAMCHRIPELLWWA